MTFIFTNIIGSFVVDDSLKIIDSIEFKDIKDYLNNKDKVHAELAKKHKAQEMPKERIIEVLSLFKEEKYRKEFYTRNLALTKQAIKNSVQEDQLITQTIANVSELDRVSNILSKRLREWYSLYFPELVEEVTDQEKFAELIVGKSKEELIKEMKVQDGMGAELNELDVAEMLMLAKQITEIFALRKNHELYLENIMREYCPNILSLAGTTIGAKLLELGKGLKHMALLPASTVQLLGAEKALFRHIKTGSRSPKHGIIINHPIIQHAKKNEKGKAARNLADKLSLCARLDYFKGDFKAEDYRKELEEKFN